MATSRSPRSKPPKRDAPASITNPLIAAATRTGITDMDLVKNAARMASSSGQSVVDAVIELSEVEEGKFLEALAAELQWPWQAQLETQEDAGAELKRVCPARLALRPLLSGQGDQRLNLSDLD